MLMNKRTVPDPLKGNSLTYAGEGYSFGSQILVQEAFMTFLSMIRSKLERETERERLELETILQVEDDPDRFEKLRALA
jgi:hypothetical protein